MKRFLRSRIGLARGLLDVGGSNVGLDRPYSPREVKCAPQTVIAVIGTVGIPAAYGGFETLVENLARFHQEKRLSSHLVVYCSGKSYLERHTDYLGAELRYMPLSANGIASVLYDSLSLASAVLRGADVCLLLGVSGAIGIPIVRLLSRTRVVTNIDGIEWKREKWRGCAKWFLRMSEWLAVRFSHEVIADNGAIAQHVAARYRRTCHVIAYGGDHAVSVIPAPYDGVLPERYALALCRIEPENNPQMILEAFAGAPHLPLVFIGNWNNSDFGRTLRKRYASFEHLILLDPIYDTQVLWTIRANSFIYVHGHSAGGTNPSLVEMMHFGRPVVAFDCSFNRFTTENRALFFGAARELQMAVSSITPSLALSIGDIMRHIACQRYTWNVIGTEYFDLMTLTGKDVDASEQQNGAPYLVRRRQHGAVGRRGIRDRPGRFRAEPD
jgi:glycosyltransferase involved in cell wall biosynthesis